MITMNRDINTVQKRIRARVIKDYLNGIGTNECVCITCGNAAQALVDIGVNVTAVVKPKVWYTPEEIHHKFGKLFDATSGHLPMFLMARIADELKKHFPPGVIGDSMHLATGSGETFVTLRMAYPFKHIIPVYNLDAATEFHERAPLNDLVDAIYQKTRP